MDIVRQIQDLADRERDAAASVDAGTAQTPMTADPARELARQLFRARHNSEPEPAEAWATWSEGVPLHTALRLESPLIVDLRPVTPDEFTQSICDRIAGVQLRGVLGSAPRLGRCRQSLNSV